jgi:hypothetical protein
MIAGPCIEDPDIPVFITIIIFIIRMYLLFMQVYDVSLEWLNIPCVDVHGVHRGQEDRRV